MGVTYLTLDSFFAEEVSIIEDEIVSERLKKLNRKGLKPIKVINTLPSEAVEGIKELLKVESWTLPPEDVEGREELLKEITIEVLKKLAILKEDIPQKEIDLDVEQFFYDFKRGKFNYSKKYRGVDWDKYLANRSLMKKAIKKYKEFDAIEI